jgi:NADH:ubiquinone oxidoreductase subunit 5 (subunit L)/multisubunit Na+/H+ antiporter MnhA subunit
LTIFCGGWLALRETSLVQRTAYLTAAAFGFVVVALGLGNLPAALLQLLGLSLGVPLLFICADLLQIENAPAPPDPKNAALSIPIRRPTLFRPLLVGFYVVGAIGVLGLPFSPAYTARWQTLSEMLGTGYRFYFGLAGTGLALMMLSLIQGFALFLQDPHHTEDRLWNVTWGSLISPGLFALFSAGLGFAPILASDWLSSVTSRVLGVGCWVSGVGNDTCPPSPDTLGGPGSLFGLLLLMGIVGGALIIWRVRKLQPAPAFNGGQLFGAEAEAEQKLYLSRNRAIVLKEEVEAFGFEDEFFKVGLGNMAPPPPKVELRLSSADYFGPLTGRLTEAYKLLDSSYSGGFFARIFLRIIGFIRRAIEWLTVRFYPALAAFILLIFILLLTR